MNAHPSDFLVEGSETYQELHQADERTLKLRGWASDVIAAFRTAKSYFAREYGDELRGVYGAEWLTVIDRAFEVYAALMDAAAQEEGSTKARVRRFRLSNWRAQTYLSRTSAPYMEEEAFRRFKGRMERAWSRYGWKWIHQLQCVTACALFERDAIPYSENRDGEPTAYTDHLTDLLVATIQRSRQSRRKRVDRIEEAFAECLKEFRAGGRVPPYAPEWQPEPKAEDVPEPKAEVDDAEPTAKVESIVRGVARRSAKIAQPLSDEETDALGLAALVWFAEEWEKRTGRPLRVPPVLEEADIEISEASADPTSCASAQGANCDFPAKTEEMTLRPPDNMSAGSPALEVLEYDPEPEPRGVSLADAEAAVAACSSVGIEHVKVVFVDDTKPRGAPGGCTLAEDLQLDDFQRRLPEFLERNRASGVESFTVRLRRKDDVRLVQVDDCTAEVKDVLAPFCFLAHATSPGNWQVWLCLADDLTPAQYDEARRRLLKRLEPTGANGGAYGSTRWPGSLNHKPKRRYEDGEAPRVALFYAALGRRCAVAELDAAGLLAPLRPRPSAEAKRAIRGRFPGPNEWPDMDYYLAQTGGDRSRAESKWCVRALSMGHPSASVRAELAHIGAKAGLRQRDNYIDDTVERAVRWLDLNPSAGGGGMDATRGP